MLATKADPALSYSLVLDLSEPQGSGICIPHFGVLPDVR